MKAYKTVPIPDTMRALPLDRRGYPVPVIALVDSDGRPHFTTTDEAARQRCIQKNLCAICGQKLLRTKWLIGGPGAAFMPNGAYLDPPMHEACARYAVQVCPYIAMPSYKHRIEGKTIDPSKIVGTVIQVDLSMLENRPPVFVLSMHVKQSYVMQHGRVQYIVPHRPLRNVEFWQAGELIPEIDGALMSEQYLAETMAARRT